MTGNWNFVSFIHDPIDTAHTLRSRLFVGTNISRIWQIEKNCILNLQIIILAVFDVTDISLEQTMQASKTQNIIL